jgi:hypothetical protein
MVIYMTQNLSVSDYKQKWRKELAKEKSQDVAVFKSLTSSDTWVNVERPKFYHIIPPFDLLGIDYEAKTFFYGQKKGP